MGKRHVAKKAAPAAAPGAAAVQPESAFERMSHRRHFDVVGRKLKGSNKNLAHARSEANEKRKRTLLQEYRQHGKAGGFIDRRFGEGDESVGADEKALWRMQRLRQMQFGKASRFALADEADEDVLTHLGSALADQDGADDFVPSDGDDEELNDLITREYHFGGGLFTRKEQSEHSAAAEGGAEGAELPRKTKKEVMSEIIAKSKTAKRERAKEKEADDEQLDALDLTFKALADAGALRDSLRTSTGHMRPAKPTDRRRKGVGADAADGDEDDFDALASELARDTRASRVADRMKTADEVAAEGAAQLEELERKRVKRMRQRGSDDEASEEEDDMEASGKGGYAAKRLKRKKRERSPSRKAARPQTGDDLDANYALDDEGDAGEDSGASDGDGSEEEEDDGEEGDGADDLQRSFKSRVGSIKGRGDLQRGLRRLRRLGILKDGGDAADSSGEESGSDEGEEEEEEDESGEESGSDADAGDEGEEEEEEAEAAGGASSGEDADDAPPVAPKQSARARKSELELASAKLPAGAAQRGAAAARRASTADAEPAAAVRAPRRAAAADELPFTFDAPTNHAQFACWVTGRSAEELSSVVQRVCACHAISLGPDNRRKMQVFFGVLLVHFDVLAQQTPLPQAHLDVLVPHILALSREVPFFAATASRARLVRMQKAASDSLARGAARWPPPRSIMLLRLFTLMFPTSDFRHPVLTPIAVLLGQYLSHSEVRGGQDAATGVLVASLAVQIARASQRFVPEAIAFLTALVHASAEEGAAALQGLPAHLAHQVGGPWLHPGVAGGKARTPAAPTGLPLARIFGTPADDSYFESAELRAAALHAALATLATAADGVAALPAADALLAPARDAALRLTRARCSSQLAPQTLAAAAAVVAAHARAASAVHLPLQLHNRKREAIKSFNPRFEEDGFVQGRDYDIDRERSEARSLKKQIARESKGAARELRKDNRFLAEERTRALQVEADEREGKYRAAMSFLEQQEADFKSGGQGGAAKKRRKQA